MIKNCGLILLCIVLIFSGSITQADSSIDDNSRKIADKTTSAVIGITCVIRKGGRDAHYYGTGVLISEDGYALTNMTVIPSKPYKTNIFLADGRITPAAFIGVYPNSESTLIKARAKNLPYLKIANSQQLQVGASVYTLGNPFHSIENDGQVAISQGIISGIYKVANNIEPESKYRDLVLETTAALNPGSDGGPLVDHQGRLVGIMSLAMRGERRIGTAIPVHKIVQDIIKEHPFAMEQYQFETISPSQLIAKQAWNISNSIVAIDIERKTPEAQPKKPTKFHTIWAQKDYEKQLIMLRPKGMVTGIIIENGNYIITSAHHFTHNKAQQNPLTMIKKIQIWAEGQEKPIIAKVVARHLPYDIALLKPEKPLSGGIVFGNSSGLKIGQWVGIPGRLANTPSMTLTTGVVSAIDRNHNLTKAYQTQAFINYSNSGAPVIDLNGQVIGMAAHVTPGSSWGLNSGVGLFVGATEIKSVLAKLIAGTTTKNPHLPFLGVGLWVSRKLPQGALVSTVTGGSAAYKAGVLPGDLLISLDGKPVGEWSDLVRLITSKTVGQEIEFELIRSGETVKLKAKLGKRPF